MLWSFRLASVACRTLRFSSPSTSQLIKSSQIVVTAMRVSTINSTASEGKVGFLRHAGTISKYRDLLPTIFMIGSFKHSAI